MAEILGWVCQKKIIITIPDEYQDKVNEIQKCNCHFTCSQTNKQQATGEVTQYLSHNKGDYDIRITPCKAAADKALLEMINGFNKEDFDKWLIQQKD